MDLSYDLYVRHEIYELLRTLPSGIRRKIIAFMESLPADPFQAGESVATDREGRPCQVRIVGRYAIYFWADHAVKEVRVVDMVDADQV